MSSQQNSNTSTCNTSGGRPPLVHSHSTHAPLETFDQATRDAAARSAAERKEEEIKQIEQQSASSPLRWSSSTSAGSSRTRTAGATKMGDVAAGAVDTFDINDAYISQANSAVQLDRDVRKSRKLVDDSNQKGVHGRTPSAEAIPPNTNENIYIE